MVWIVMLWWSGLLFPLAVAMVRESPYKRFGWTLVIVSIASAAVGCWQVPTLYSPVKLLAGAMLTYGSITMTRSWGGEHSPVKYPLPVFYGYVGLISVFGAFVCNQCAEYLLK